MIRMPGHAVRRALGVLAMGAVMSACGAAPRTGPAPAGGERLPAIPARAGALAIDVVYPGEGQSMADALAMLPVRARGGESGLRE